jgi:hypothetical protein
VALTALALASFQDRFGYGREFSLGRAFGSTFSVRSRDKKRVQAVGDGRRGPHGGPALTEGI